MVSEKISNSHISPEGHKIVSCVTCGRQSITPTMKAEIPPQIKAIDQKTSFAYLTIKDRLPLILSKTSEFFNKHRKELHNFPTSISEPSEGEQAELVADAKFVASEITKLREDVESNTPVRLFEKLDLNESLQRYNDDVDLWNAYLNENKLADGSLARWFDSAWLLVECYMYRRLKDIMLRTKHMKSFDPFVDQKLSAAQASITQMNFVGQHLIDVEKAYKESTNGTHPSERVEFGLFVLISLWSNKADLSLSSASAEKVQSYKLTTDLRDSLEPLNENILSNNVSEFWFRAQKIKDLVKSRRKEGVKEQDKPLYVDLVADNSGYELFADMCLIHFLILMLSGPNDTTVVKFRLNLKTMPWFVSDAMRSDVDLLLSLMKNSEKTALQELSNKWRSFLDSGLIEIREHRFWTLPHDYSMMSRVSEDLYKYLSESSLIIFKGDLNYRKLTGDRRWHILTPLGVALRGFEPAPLVTLRTIKAEVVVGIEDVNIFARINNNELPRDWMSSGNYGLIQYLDV